MKLAMRRKTIGALLVLSAVFFPLSVLADSVILIVDDVRFEGASRADTDQIRRESIGEIFIVNFFASGDIVRIKQEDEPDIKAAICDRVSRSLRQSEYKCKSPGLDDASMELKLETVGTYVSGGRIKISQKFDINKMLKKYLEHPMSEGEQHKIGGGDSALYFILKRRSIMGN